MTKADIINRVSEELGIDRRTVGLVIESFMKCVKIIENRPGVNLPLPLSGRGGF